MSIRNRTNIQETLSPRPLHTQQAARFAVGHDGYIIYANERFHEISGIDDDDRHHLFDVLQFSEEILPEDEDITALPSGSHEVYLKDNGTMTEFHFDWLTTADNKHYLVASAMENDIDFIDNQQFEDIDLLMQRIQESTARIENTAKIPAPANLDTLDSYAVFADLTDDFMVITDVSGAILQTNHAFLSLFNDAIDANDQFTFFDLFKMEDQSHIKRTCQSIVQNNLPSQAIHFEAEMVAPNGEIRWIDWRQKCRAGNIYSIGRDITELKEEQSNLERREKQLSEAEAIGRMGHWQWLIGEEYISWSEEIFRIFGVDQHHFKPSINSLTDLVHKRDLGRVIQVFQRAIIEEKDYDMEFRIVRPGGDERFVMCEGRCEKNDEGEVIALYGILQDMTERMLYEEELRQAKEASEQAYAARTRFLANMSHELRTPLNAIIGFSEMIESQMLGPIFNEKYVEYSTSIKESGHHLLDLISDILDMSKIEAGKHVLDLESVNMNNVIERCFEMIQGRAAEQNVALRPFELNHDLNIIADRRAMTQIFLNLLSNAVKFTKEHGSVWIECYENAEHISFKVCDTGIGIPPNKLASVLKPFEQASSEYTREHEGTGLGLAITKELVEMHGGTIHIDSTVNVGTTVSVRIPYQAQMAQNH